MARFIRRGVSKIYFLPVVAGYTVAGTGAPTRAEITAGTNLSPEIAEVSGWMLENATVATPDLGTDFDSGIPGIDSAADSSLTFYEQETTNVIETLLPKGTAGFVYIMRKGDVPASLSGDLFPVRVGSRSAQITVGADPARFVVNFSITSRPSLDKAIPAAT
jgi:hypothetical protein